MRICIVHTGLHKTGTSSLQNFLHANSALLAGEGILYPKAGREFLGRPGVQHMGLVRAVIHDPKNRYGERPMRELEAEIAAQPHQTLLISAELISALVFGKDDVRFLDYLKSLGYDVKPVTYIRPQDQLIVSKYTQRVKSFRSRDDFDDFFESVVESRLHKFRKMPKTLKKAGYKGHFLPYDAAIRRDGIELAFARAMLGIAGRFDEAATDRVLAALARNVPARSNESVGPVELALCRTLAAEIDPEGTLSTRLTKVLPRVVHTVVVRRGGGESDRYKMLTAAQVERIAEIYGTANRLFAQRVWSRDWVEVFGPPEPAGLRTDIAVSDDPAQRLLYEKLLPVARRLVRQKLGERAKMLEREGDHAAVATLTVPAAQ